jgi:hypothetical protein
MPTAIEIEVGGVRLRGELADTDCARAIAAALPLEVRYDIWGEEFYFEIPVYCELDDTATSEVDVGTIGYWPPGHALAIFFGRTPMSTDARPVPASDVNLVGRLTGARKLLDVDPKSARKIAVRARKAR